MLYYFCLDVNPMKIEKSNFDILFHIFFNYCQTHKNKMLVTACVVTVTHIYGFSGQASSVINIPTKEVQLLPL